jgi:hypothetical protein
MLRFVMVGATVLFLGCGKGSDTAPQTTFAGSWSGGTWNNGFQTSSLTFTLTQYGTAAFGDGRISGPPGADPSYGSTGFQVGGTVQSGVAAPTFSLTLRLLGDQRLEFTGTTERNGQTLSMVGKINGPDFVNVSATLTKIQ